MSATEQAIERPSTENTANTAQYRLDESEIILPLKVTQRGREILTHHRLRKPSPQESLEYADAQVYQTNTQNGEERVDVTNNTNDSLLYDKLCIAVSGYGLGVDHELLASPELLAKIPSTHKAAAIAGIYKTSSEVEEDLMPSAGGFSLDDESIVVVQTIGGFAVRHTLAYPSESQLKNYQDQSADVKRKREGKRIHQTIKINPRAGVRLYNALVQNITGATLNGETFNAANKTAFIAAIDPLHKADCVETLIDSLNATLSD